MKKVIGIFLLYFLSSFAFSSNYIYAYDLYIKSMKAPVYQAPDASSTIVADCKQGEKVEGIEEKANWHKISTGKKSGWVFKYLVDSHPPLKKSSIYGKYNSLEGKYKAFADKARRRPSSYAAAAAARGLREKRDRFSENYRLDYEALEKMEAIEITENEARLFLEEGIKNEKAK